jgi:hypothetical protein
VSVVKVPAAGVVLPMAGGDAASKPAPNSKSRNGSRSGCYNWQTTCGTECPRVGDVAMNMG